MSVPKSAANNKADEESFKKADYESLAAFRYALRQFIRFSEEAAVTAGLSPQQHQALLAIKGFPGRDLVTIGELAEKLQIKHHSAGGLVDRLEVDGYVERQHSSEDARRVFVVLTARGERVLARLSASHQQELRRIGPTFRALLDQVAPE
ncbi:MarR family winged helix-turn-helix transcriptional regulator [Verrucomicrobiota bacterium sgz303538]